MQIAIFIKSKKVKVNFYIKICGSCIILIKLNVFILPRLSYNPDKALSFCRMKPSHRVKIYELIDDRQLGWL
jgi:hypothetical protein